MSFYIGTILEKNKIMEHVHNTLAVPCKKSKTVSFTFSIMKKINLLVLPSRLQVKLICCIALGSGWST